MPDRCTIGVPLSDPFSKESIVLDKQRSKSSNSVGDDGGADDGMKVALTHLDLGIGGAEQLVVHLACALQNAGHDVEMFTSHHDPSHCFPATRDGTLKVTVYGDWLPRRIFGVGHLFCALLRMYYLVFRLWLSGQKFDVVVNDQVSAINPWLRLLGPKVVFYGHFPDLLLCTARGSALKQFYRSVLDNLEAKTTAQADVVFVNSEFTKTTFFETFPALKGNATLEVLYPPVDLTEANKARNNGLTERSDFTEIRPLGKDPFFMSLNRYERKKNIGLALEAFAKFRNGGGNPAMKLVIAGGYDHLVEENVQHYEELVSIAKQEKIFDHVLFLRSISNDLRLFLMREAAAIVYTPTGEHFGMIPVEGMALGTPVIAVNSGGPKESVKSGKTGKLCESTADDFSEAMAEFAKVDKASLKSACVENANRFGLESFGAQLDDAVRRPNTGGGVFSLYFTIFMFIGVVVGSVAVVVQSFALENDVPLDFDTLFHQAKDSLLKMLHF